MKAQLGRWVIFVMVSIATGCAAADRAASNEAVVGFIAAENAAGIAAQRGAELGATEASHAGELIGRSFTLLTEEADSPAELEEAVGRLLEQGAFAIVGGFDEEGCEALSKIAEKEEVLFLNVGCPSDALRRDPGRYTFHIEGSDSLYREARRSADSAEAPGDTLPVLWHAGLTRYGAAQLNDRFLGQTRFPADSPAWAAWMAMKIVWETLQRSDAPDPDALANLLTDEETRFDGHKGEPLRFDPETHQLLQPLYLANPETLATLRADELNSASPVPREIVPLTGDAYAFVSNEGSGDVSVIDLKTFREVSRIPVGARPRGIQIGPDGSSVFVALSDDAPTAATDQDAIAAIAVREGAVVARHSAGTDPEQFALSPDGAYLYAANEDAGTASITDLASGEVLATLVVGIEPEGVAVSPDGRWVYVTAETSNTVSVIDTRRREVVASFLVDVRPRGVTFSPTGPRAYVTSEISGTVSVIDTNRHEVVETISLVDEEAKPVGVAAAPDGRRIYVANGHAHSVAVIDAATDRVIGQVSVGRRPWGIAVSPDGQRIYTANGGSNDVSVIDAATLRVIETVPVGDRPWGVAIYGRP